MLGAKPWLIKANHHNITSERMFGSLSGKSCSKLHIVWSPWSFARFRAGACTGGFAVCTS